MRCRVVQIKGGLIDVAFAEGEEIRLSVVAADFKTQAAGFQTRGGGVGEDDGEEFVDLLRIDLKDDNDVDHERKRESIFAEHATCVLRMMAVALS